MHIPIKLRESFFFLYFSRQYEQTIQDYQGNDPLTPWIEYVQWIQRAYAENEDHLREKLVPVVETCTREFQDVPQYQNSKKYLRLWIIYVHTSTVRHISSIFSTISSIL